MRIRYKQTKKVKVILHIKVMQKGEIKMQVGWVLQEADKQLPEWLTDNLKAVCDCGGKMENFYNKRGEITARRCSNPKCPYMMARKIVGLCDILGVKGIGEATALKLIHTNNLNSHFEAIPFIFTDKKPQMSLYTFLRICFIHGIDTSWKLIIGENETLTQLYKNYNGQYRSLLEANKELILKGAEYVEFMQVTKPTLDAVVTGTVMISGNIKGFDNRNNFVYLINILSKGLIRLSISEHKRKTGIMALIQESDTPNKGKAECALSSGIPIMTPEEFKAFIYQELKKGLDKKGEKR